MNELAVGTLWRLYQLAGPIFLGRPQVSCNRAVQADHAWASNNICNFCARLRRRIWRPWANVS